MCYGRKPREFLAMDEIKEMCPEDMIEYVRLAYWKLYPDNITWELYNESDEVLGWFKQEGFQEKNKNLLGWNEFVNLLKTLYGNPKLSFEKFKSGNYRQTTPEDIVACIEKIFDDHNLNLPVKKYKEFQNFWYIIGKEKKYRIYDGWISQEDDYKKWNHQKNKEKIPSPLKHFQALSYELEEIEYEKVISTVQDLLYSHGITDVDDMTVWNLIWYTGNEI